MAALATVPELETHLKRDVDDAQAQQLLDLSSGAVRAYCGWNITREDTTFQVDGDGSPLLSLPTLYLLDLIELRVDTVPVDLTTWDRPMWSRKGQIYKKQGGWTPRAVIEADVTHGFDPAPDLVKLCTLDMAARQLNNPLGLVSATTGQVTRTWGTGTVTSTLSPLHEKLLDRYRL